MDEGTGRAKIWVRRGLGALAGLVLPCAWAGGGMDDLAQGRQQMIERDIKGRGVKDEALLEAMRTVPRHEFVPPSHRREAYSDRPLPIGCGQTISQPYIVAAMTELLGAGPDAVVLEVGTGSGYQAAVLASICKWVYTIEIIPELAEEAEKRLVRLGHTNCTVRIGDGYAGWPEHAPFDGILVTAAPDEVPPPLIEQLKPGARMVIPVGPVHAVQNLEVVEKGKDGRVRRRSVMAVRFVPLVGQDGRQR